MILLELLGEAGSSAEGERDVVLPAVRVDYATDRGYRSLALYHKEVTRREGTIHYHV